MADRGSCSDILVQAIRARMGIRTLVDLAYFTVDRPRTELLPATQMAASLQESGQLDRGMDK